MIWRQKMRRSIPNDLISAAAVVILSITLLSAAGSAQTSAAAAREYKRLVSLSAALRKIPINGLEREPYKSLVSRNQKDLVYSDPSGEWLVLSKRYWDLQAKYARLPIADEIAWSAANNPIPGECEGYINCYVYESRRTFGQYLKLYPHGKYARQATTQLIADLNPIVKDIGPGEMYSGPGAGQERNELKRLLREIDAIVKRTSQAKKAALRVMIRKLLDAYK